MIRTGFPVRVVSHPSLRTHGGQRAHPPDLSIGLVYLRDILHYLHRVGISFYRVASTLLPPVADAPRQMRDYAPELALLAEQVQAQAVRLTLHLGYHVALGSADETVAARSLAEVELQAQLLQHLGMGAEGVMVVHVGGPCEIASLWRFATRYRALSPHARSRLVVEHNEHRFSLGMLLCLHQQCGVPVVFDYLHWRLHNPEQLSLGMALGLALATWPKGVRPKIHLSTPRSEAHLLPARGDEPARVVPPHPGQHADFIAPTDLMSVLEAAHGLPPFDLMIEAKAGDLALFQARADIARRSPELAMVLA